MFVLHYTGCARNSDPYIHKYWTTNFFAFLFLCLVYLSWWSNKNLSFKPVCQCTFKFPFLAKMTCSGLNLFVNNQLHRFWHSQRRKKIGGSIAFLWIINFSGLQWGLCRHMFRSIWQNTELSIISSNPYFCPIQLGIIFSRTW